MQADSYNLFGLLPSRFLFKDGGPEHHVPLDAVKEAQDQLAEAEEFLEELRQELEGAIKTYNNERLKGGLFKKGDPEFAELTLNLEQPNIMFKQIDDLTSAINIVLQQTKPKLSIRKINHFQKQLDFLQDIRTITSDVVGISTAGTGDKSKRLELAHRARLRRKSNRITEGEEAIEAWEKQPFYSKIEEYFESASRGPEFDDLWSSPEGMESGKQSENRMLFMSIMAMETNGFTSEVVFGGRFGENPEENIKNFPFIYREWVKRDSGIGFSFDLRPEATMPRGP